MRKTFRELARLVFWGFWIGTWLYFSLHYWTMLMYYKSIDGFFLDHPLIYTAAETWLLVSLLALMFAAYELIKFVTASPGGCEGVRPQAGTRADRAPRRLGR